MTGPDPRRITPEWYPVAAAGAIALAAVGALAAPRIGVPAWIGALVAAGAAALAVLGLPSFSTRRATVLVLGVAGLGLLRHAAFPAANGLLVICWAVATLLALLFVDRADAEQVPAMPGSPPLAGRVGEAVRNAVPYVVLVALAVIAFAPTLTDAIGRHVAAGAVPTPGDAEQAPASLRATRQLDMTTRPRLSNRVVFTVDADRADFWRGEVFDVWDGRRWTRADDERFALPSDGIRTELHVDPHDAGARFGSVHTQRFEVEADFSEVVFGAPAAVAVETPRVLVGRRDGTAGAVGGFGRGSVYTVTSRSFLATPGLLRAAAVTEVPAAILERYAQPPVTTPRVRALAHSITAGATTDYDRVRAIEDWLGAHARYSIKAPLSPVGVDVVDHFLFTSRIGWCEQVASSLVVLARSAGIPARLVTGFTPGQRDPLSGRFVVRERHAHAWAEVYFAGIGWQGFDPTASVPLAGEAKKGGSWLDAAGERGIELAIAVAVAVAVMVTGPGLLARFRRLRRARRSWVAHAFDRLERAGRAAGRPRRAEETAQEYAAGLAEVLGEPQLAAVGAALDRAAFGPEPPAESVRAAADTVLRRVTSRPARGATVRRTVKGIP